jgi:hypothetical protein
VRPGQPAVGLGVPEDRGALVVGQVAADLAREAGDQRAGRDLGALQDHRAGGDQCARADARPVEDDGAHPDEHVVADRAAVQHGPVPHADPGADRHREARVGVDDHAVLQVRPRPDRDRRGVGAHHGAVPDTHLSAERDRAGEDGGRGHPRLRVHLGRAPVDRDDQRRRGHRGTLPSSGSRSSAVTGRLSSAVR